MKKLILIFTILTFFIGNSQQDKPSGYHKDGILFDDAQTENVETLWYNSFTNQYGIIRYDRVLGKFRALENGIWKDVFGIEVYTIAQRDAMSLGVKDRKQIYVVDTGVNEVQIWDGDSWETLSGDLKNPNNIEYYGVSKSKSPSENYQALAMAVAAKDTLYVNGFYDIERAGNGEIQLDQTFRLIGRNKGDGFNLVSDTDMFSGDANGILFELDNIKITYSTDPLVSESRIFSILSGEYYEKVVIKNCDITGTVRLIHCIGSDLDPSLNTFGINKVEVLDNNFQNVSGWIFFIRNSPSKYEVIKRNTVKNLQGAFYFSALDNGSINRALINDVRKNIDIQGNIVINDDDLLPSTVPSTYFSLAVVESFNVDYSNNKVSGLKTSSAQAIYDAYLSCTNVVYTNNQWYNNVCFDSTETSLNHLIKSKGHTSAAYTNPKRIYKNNIWRIEEDFLNAVGKTVDDTWNNFYEIAAESDFIFENNIIDIKGVVPSVSYQSVNKLSILNNDITFDFIKQTGGIFSFKYSNEYDVNSSISNNQILIKNNPESIETSFLDSDTSLKWDNKIYINNNHIKCDNDSFKYFIKSINCSELEMIGNSIESKSQALFYNITTGNINAYNNNFNTSLSGNYFFMDRGDFILENGTFKLTSLNDGDLRFGVNNSVTGETWYSYTITMEDSNGINKFNFKYRVYDDAGTTKINFYNEAGTEIDQEISTGTGNDFIKINRLSNYDNGTQMFFINHSSIPRFSSIGEPDTEILKTVELTVYQGSGKLTEDAFLRAQEYTVATLPTGVRGQIAIVVDAYTPTFGAVASGGGSEVALVLYNGTDWIYQ